MTITSKTSTAEQPREIDGVPCEVCVSEQYLENHRDLVDDLKLRIVDLKEKRSAAAALAEDRKKRIEKKNKTIRKLRLKVDRQKRKKTLFFGLGAGGVAVVGGVVILIIVGG